MKHANFLAEQLAPYPVHVQLKCINYKKWKVWIKTTPGFVISNWRQLIKADCLQFERFIRGDLEPSWVSHLSLLNTDTFYKICKKIDKNFSAGAVQYYKDTIRRRTYKFTDVSFVTLIGAS